MNRLPLGEESLTLKTILTEHRRVEELKRLAAICRKNKEPLPTRKTDLAKLIMDHLEGDGLHLVWEELDELQRAAVAEVVHSDSTEFDPGRFRAKYGADPSFGTADKWGTRLEPSRLGLLLYDIYGHGTRLPADLKLRLAKLVPAPRETAIETLHELPPAWARTVEHWNPRTKQRQTKIERIPLTVHQTERRAPRELAAVLRLIDAGKLAVSDKTRRPTAAAITAVTAVLDDGDYYAYKPPKNKWEDDNAGPIRAFAWPLLLQAGGLAQLAGTRLALTKAGREALAAPAAPVLKRLWERWIDTTLLDEAARIECVKGLQGKGKSGLTAASGRREAIAATLAACPIGRWIETDELRRYARARDRTFLVSRNTWHLYIADPQYGSLGYAGSEGILESRYWLCLLFEYAATLGLIDAACIPPAGARDDYSSLWGTDELPFFSRYDGLMYVRINALGAYCLDIAAEYAPAPLEAKPVLSVLPSLEIAALDAELDPGDQLALDTYAVRQSERVWRLEPAKLLETAEAGRSVAEIRNFLVARSTEPLPDTVTQLIEDVGKRCARVRDCGPALLVECDDAALAVLIASDTRTRKHCMRAGECNLVVPEASEAAFRRALREVGYLLATGGATLTKPPESDRARRRRRVA